MRHLLVPVLLLAALVPVDSVAAVPSAFANQSKPMAAKVRILAVSSSSRQTFAGNQEVYLVDVEIKGKHEFARLFDQYPGFGLPIRGKVLQERPLFKMKLTREPECDVPGSEVFLRGMASSIYDVSVKDTLATHQSDAIPCFKTLHQTIRIAKN